jgi:hypothetical protein
LVYGNYFSIRNKLNTIRIDGHGTIDKSCPITFRYYDEPVPYILKNYVIQGEGFYANRFVDASGDLVSQYYTSSSAAVTVICNSSSAIFESFKGIQDKIVYKNCKPRGNPAGSISGTEVKFYITPTIDALSDSAATTVSITINKHTFTNKSARRPGPSRIQRDIIQFTIDNNTPSLTISSPDMTSGDFYANGTLNMLFVADRDIKDIQADYFDITNATLQNIQRVSGKYNEYSAILTPQEAYAEMQITIQLKTNVMESFAGMLNTNKSNFFIWNYDGISPFITSLTSSNISSNDYYNASSINIDVEFNENIV